MAIYQPLSPAGSLTYEPVSPRRSVVYEPSSPRKEPFEWSFLKRKIPPPKQSRFVPINNWREHIRTYLLNEQRNPRFEKEEYRSMIMGILDKIRSEHEEWEVSKETPEPPPTKEPIAVSSDLDHVVVRLRVVGGDRVRAYVGAPMSVLHEKYYSKCIKPPLDVQLRALKNFGYPDHVLEKVLINAQKPKPNDDDFIESIFGKYTNKTSKPKKKKVMDELISRLKIKKVKVVKDDESDNEEE